MSVNPPQLAPLQWHISPGLTGYREAVMAMEAHVEEISRGSAPERIWLLQHPPVITAGTSADAKDLIAPDRFPVESAGRGGQFTYHGPGQRIVYAMLDLSLRGKDVRALVSALERWAIDALGRLDVEAFTSDAGTGIWVMADGRLGKIGAIGLRVRRWISFHGLALNVTTDLGAYDAIVPCGIAEHPVVRLVDLQPGASMADLDAALLATLPDFIANKTARRTDA